MDKQTMVSQLRDLITRIEAVEQEQRFFGFEVSRPFTAPEGIFETDDLFAIDESINVAIDVYTDMVSQIKTLKFQSPVYQRCIGVYNILQELGISISNFQIFELDSDFLLTLHKQTLLHIIRMENAGTSNEKPMLNIKENTHTFETCIDLLDNLSKLIMNIMRLDDRISKGQTQSLPGFDQILGTSNG